MIIQLSDVIIRVRKRLMRGHQMRGKKSAASPATSLITAPGTARVAPERLSDIAIEVERLCGAVRAAAPQLAFSDEPSFFAKTLNSGAR